MGHLEALFPRRAVAVTAPRIHWFGMEKRTKHSMLWRRTAALVSGITLSGMALGQYPGQVAKKAKDAPALRAVAVLEWTGDPFKPKACRIVPITVFDGEKLQDAGVYLARPEPLALAGQVEYELKDNGTTFGLFDVENAGQEQGMWVGYGKWKALPPPKLAKETAPAKIDDEVTDDKPVLHRKKHSGDAPEPSKPTGGANGTGATASSQSDDPDRPKMHKKDDSGAHSTADSAPQADPDRPKLEKKPEASKKTEDTKAPSPDADQPSLAKARPQLAGDIGNVSSVDSDDPDRPKLQRGKVNGTGMLLVPSLMGMPPDMQQTVAISDGKSRPDRAWTYSWANPDDQNKMKAAVEEIARQALGIKSAEPTPAPAARKPGSQARRAAKPAAPSAQPAPAPLADEQFRVFELAYGAGATMVLTAHTEDSGASQRFVTIIAQPDLYGHVLVLLKSVTDRAHLDETPRMRLVDAVDVLADNRGELLFELRGEAQRQFALYRIYRGRADQMFVSGGGVYGTLSSD
jgi:hypothetical protein